MRSVAFACSIILVAACASDRASVAVEHPEGCYAISTGKASWWRPRSLLAPASSAVQYFALLPAKQGNRARADWVVLSRDSSSRFGPAVANWFVDRDSVIRVLFYDVDWGYRMALRPVTKDSLEEFVHFDWEIGPDPQARLRGQRIACPPDFN